MLLYHLVVHSGLWYAPIYAWLLLVSAWARRATFLWAVLPPLAIGLVEMIAFHTTHFAILDCESASSDSLRRAFNIRMPDGSRSIPIYPDKPNHSGNFWLAPGLWIGLIFAAAFLAAAVRLRRYREPI